MDCRRTRNCCRVCSWMLLPKWFWLQSPWLTQHRDAVLGHWCDVAQTQLSTVPAPTPEVHPSLQVGKYSKYGELKQLLYCPCVGLRRYHSLHDSARSRPEALV
jgi:hypothetical protein